ncbi:MAG TPA: glycosyltransferase [Verrucomicrobiae bacterium]|jgi:spore maturation protein CgeD|nr:glycosyltransferase [Verrucomicrobiae bacterium]
MANISIIIVSHNKPAFVKEAIDSVLHQTYQDWEAILVDSGVLLKQGFFEYIKDSRFKIIASEETPDMVKNTNMASWCFNRILNSNRLTGELTMYLADDDLLYKEAFETFWNFYTHHNREPQGMYSSQDIGLVDREGRTQIIGKRIADRPAGRFCKGRKLDCQVDYLQFCHTRAILDRMREAYRTSEFHLEDRSHGDHADGIFLEKIGALTKIYNIDKVLSMNRRTVSSINLEYAESRLGRFLILVKVKIKGIRRIFNRGYLF